MSTAKSMATSYLNGKRNGTNNTKFNNLPTRFKSSTSNLASSSQINSSNGRLKSTSMTNLIAGDSSLDPNNNGNNKLAGLSTKIQRPASRNALDSIHNGMNAKYSQVQSKVLLQNIRPTAKTTTTTSTINKSKSNTLQASTGNGYGVARSGRHTPTSLGAVKVPSDRTQLLNKLKALQEEIDRNDEERENFKHELEREKADKLEQIQQLKQELQDKLAEHDKQHEEYHQKLLEAYELADQNRRAADTVLTESRQRDEESRKRIEELESQLNELKEFVTMKEEMTGKMYELKEQIREERERYEEQLKSLHKVFENEKLRLGDFESNRSDCNSNYFKRNKPSLQSNESINGIGECPNCCQNSSQKQQMHRSEHDMYGSKLSTRMQDTARSAWKASKHFASSVITGKAVGISGCRKRGSGSSGNNNNNDNKRVETIQATNSEEQQLTSVVKVESTNSIVTGGQVKSTTGSGVDQQHHHPSQSLIRVDQNNKLTIVTKFNDNDMCGQSSLGIGPVNHHQTSDINRNNNQQQQASIPTPNSSAGESERIRCESSSSGRGTSTDGCSSSSQNGDEEHHAIHHNNRPDQQQQSSVTTTKKATDNGLAGVGDESPAQVANRQNLFDGNNLDDNGNKITVTVAEYTLTEIPLGGQATKRRESHQQHRRKSSIFKPSKVFGSEASLNKWRYFFTGKESTGSAKISQPIGKLNNNNNNISEQQQQYQKHLKSNSIAEQQKHLESSRLRCMELNRATRMPSLPADTTTITEGINDHENSLHSSMTTAMVVEKCQLTKNNNNNKPLEGEHQSGNDDSEQTAATTKQILNRDDENDHDHHDQKKKLGQGNVEEQVTHNDSNNIATLNQQQKSQPIIAAATPTPAPPVAS